MTSHKPTPFEEMDLPHEEDHPLDVYSRSYLSRELKESVEAATQRLTGALGNDLNLWIDLEALLNESRQQREEALYNVGVEHGLTAGRSEALATLLDEDPGNAYRQLGKELRKQVLLSELPSMLRVSALLETAWALAREVSDSR
jgi:hypothetical protein